MNSTAHGSRGRPWLIGAIGLVSALCSSPIAACQLVDAPAQAALVTQLISPDGRQIAYGQVEVSVHGHQSVRIVIEEADGPSRGELRLAASYVDEVLWYGNDRIAYVTELWQDGYFLIDLEGRPAGRLSMPDGCDSISSQSISPDGRLIAFCGDYYGEHVDLHRGIGRKQIHLDDPDFEPESGLFVVDIERQTVKQLTKVRVSNPPAWSPDSKYIAFGLSRHVVDSPLLVIDVESGEVQRPGVQASGVTWSPQGNEIAMTTGVPESGGWVIGVPDTDRLGVLDFAAYQQERASTEQRAAPVDDGAQTGDILFQSGCGSFGPVWSRDGQWLAYRRAESTSTKDGEKLPCETVWVIRRDGTHARRVLNHAAQQLAWSTDDRTLFWVNDWKSGRIDLQDKSAVLLPWPGVKTASKFSIHGRVLDRNGAPLAGVEVRVATGSGTLQTSKPVTTDRGGQYIIHLEASGSCHRAPSRPGPGIALVLASKPGHQRFKSNLTTANFQTHDGPPSPLDLASPCGTEDIVLPGHPYRLDFVMLPITSGEKE